MPLNIDFKIAAPFVNIKEIGMLKKAGADELYCGFVDEESEKLWPIAFHTINRRGKGASFEDFITFKEAAEEAHRYNLPVYVTFNSYYTPEQYPWLIRTINKISRLKGVEGLIVSDLCLLFTLHKIGYKKKIHISTGATTFNYKTADFFASLGADRIILDRQLTAREMIDLISNRRSNIAIEIFIFNTGCMFIDGYCTFFHCNVISNPRTSKVNKNLFLIKTIEPFVNFGCGWIQGLIKNKNFEIFNTAGNKKRINNLRLRPKAVPFGCNLCNLYALKKYAGITLKVIERGENQQRVVKMVANAIKYLSRNDTNRKDYLKKAKELYFRLMHQRCSRFRCYCPESLVKGKF